MREIQEELKLDILYRTNDLDREAEAVLIGAMNVKDGISFMQNNALMIIPGDRNDMIEAVSKVHLGKMGKRCKVSGVIISGGMMPKHGAMRLLEKAVIPVLITKDDTYAIAARINSMTVKLKPQDKKKIKIIVDMVDKYLDIEKVLQSLK
jgi:phosphate acetyltransferase